MRDHHLYIIFALIVLVFLLMPRTEGFDWSQSMPAPPYHINPITELAGAGIQGSVNSGTHFPSIIKVRKPRK